MPSSIESLFQPWSYKNLSLENRLVMAPMTRMQSPNGIPNDEVASYYKKIVEGGTNLIITEGTTVNHQAANGYDKTPLFHSDKALAGWRKVIDEVHAAGGKIMPQLWHLGAVRRQGSGYYPDAESVGPSGLVSPGKKYVRELPGDEVEFVINAFVEAAVDAEKIGMDGIELHGAHGYLIDQFFWQGTNVRTDKWGGDIAGRVNFAAEIIKEIRNRVSKDFPIVMRFSQWKQQDMTAVLAPTPGELETFLQPMVDAGVDIFHCSTGHYWEPEFEGSDLNLAGWTKKITGMPTITVGAVGLDRRGMDRPAEKRDIENLLERMDRDEFDLVALGRVLLMEPEWPNLMRAGKANALGNYDPASMAKLIA